MIIIENNGENKTKTPINSIKYSIFQFFFCIQIRRVILEK